MAMVKVHRGALTVEFSSRESVWARRRSVTVPLAAVREVTCVERPLRETRGGRKGYQSFFTKIGVWGLFTGTRQLVSARRGEPGVRVLLDRAAAGGDFDEIVVSHSNAAGLARDIARGARSAA
ncbi:hypothetical protein [Streptomyces reniochalinae]|uniref:PH domain-containing protein n=1 Tax=Streptomyces reniochalinae TaxID=2250578 RepID=A0A367EHK9_9ACTN|nr:hypothetical protein [Streptomyces reniochalinae]RCG17586.1 hypothetical protein DQ392_17145 [Streptomyces reniochalinae]